MQWQSFTQRHTKLANASALRRDWPRIPLPASKDVLVQSAQFGSSVTALLDPDDPVGGVTAGKLRLELGMIGAISREGGGALNPEAGDLDVTADGAIAAKATP